MPHLSGHSLRSPASRVPIADHPGMDMHCESAGFPRIQGRMMGSTEDCLHKKWTFGDVRGVRRDWKPAPLFVFTSSLKYFLAGGWRSQNQTKVQKTRTHKLIFFSVYCWSPHQQPTSQSTCAGVPFQKNNFALVQTKTSATPAVSSKNPLSRQVINHDESLIEGISLGFLNMILSVRAQSRIPLAQCNPKIGWVLRWVGYSEWARSRSNLTPLFLAPATIHRDPQGWQQLRPKRRNFLGLEVLALSLAVPKISAGIQRCVSWEFQGVVNWESSNPSVDAHKIFGKCYPHSVSFFKGNHLGSANI